jgi:lysylphosphatidylglycerol synthetase-like protein (DUF2156 family)
MQKKQPKLEFGILKMITMKYTRALFSGLLVWMAVSFSFYILGLIPFIRDSFSWQAIIVMICIVFYAIGASQFYYKNGLETNSLLIGLLMSATALLLDVLITVPFVEIPNGRSYASFFSSPVLWLFAIINAITVYIYWKKKIPVKSSVKNPEIVYFRAKAF